MDASDLQRAAAAALPPVEGELDVPGLRDRVEVIRDRWGVPHLYAGSLEDLFLAQGFVVGSERLFQIDLALRAANGRLATMFGQLAAPMDRFARTVGWNRAGARIAGGYDELSETMSASYRAGVLAWIERMPAPPIEYLVLELAPDVPDDAGYWASAIAYLAWSLSGNHELELVRAELAERLGWDAMIDLFPELAREPARSVVGSAEARRSVFELLRAGPPLVPGAGSNNWVVSGRRTETGRPLLANDPHLQVAAPSIWIEAHLSAPAYEASGVALPFAPGIVIGRTAHHAWGFTNVGGDTQDLYLERLSEDGTSARFDGAWESITIHREPIEGRGTDEPEVLEVRETRHGPILDSYVLGLAHPVVVEGGIKQPYALRWAGADRAILPSALVRMAQASSFDAFREAIRDWAAPGQNMVYADVEGTIGYQCTGAYPVRRSGDGTLPVPGWTSEHEWIGWVPFEELPWAVDPPEGLLATANARPHDEAYPHLLGHDFLPPFRERRIYELLEASERHSVETFGAMQRDTVSIAARELAPVLCAIEPENVRQARAIALLDGWDGDLAVESAAACVYELWCMHLANEILLPRLGEELFDLFYRRSTSPGHWRSTVLPSLLARPTATWFEEDGERARDDVLRAALDGALDELTDRLGEDMASWRWGALHHVAFAGPLAIVPGLGELFTAGIVEAGGDDETLCQGSFVPGEGFDAAVIPSWRQIVDPGDPDAAVGANTTGQSGHPASPHWRDLVPGWSSGEHHPLPLSRAAVQAVAESVLALVPR